jgi:hypothetical protein
MDGINGYTWEQIAIFSDPKRYTEGRIVEELYCGRSGSIYRDVETGRFVSEKRLFEIARAFEKNEL